MTSDRIIKAVILDLDQTVTVDTGSWIYFTQMIGADPDMHIDIFSRFKSGEIEYEPAKKELFNLWGSSSNLDKKTIQKVFDRVELRKGAVEGIEYLKSKYDLCIISGAIDIFVDTISVRLGVEKRYASTKFIFDKDDQLVDFRYTLDRGKEKIKFFGSYLSDKDYESSSCAAIGDGESDMPIFRKVGLPILYIAGETTERQKEEIDTHLNEWAEIDKYL